MNRQSFIRNLIGAGAAVVIGKKLNLPAGTPESNLFITRGVDAYVEPFVHGSIDVRYVSAIELLDPREFLAQADFIASLDESKFIEP